MMMTMNAPREGQIWREVDPRFVRHIRIESVFSEWGRGVAVRTVVYAMGQWRATARTRLSFCDHERFNGKRGGYELIEDRRL
jgi:hypothetical protein